MFNFWHLVVVSVLASSWEVDRRCLWLALVSSSYDRLWAWILRLTSISAPLLMGYIAMSTVVYFVMNMLGEMTTYLPVRGVSVPYFINRFTEPSLGFAIGMSVQ